MRVEKFVLDKAAFRAKILKGDEIAEHLKDLAEKAKPSGDTIEVDTDWTATRARVRITDTSWRAMFREAREGHLSRAIGMTAGDRKVWYTTKAGKKRLATEAQIANWTRKRK